MLEQFQSSAQFGDAGPHHPFVLVPSTLAPALLLVAPTPQAKPTLAWPPRLVSTLPATNLPLETRHTCTSGSAFFSSGLCSRSSTRFLTPAPVATQRSLQKLRQQALQSFPTVFCCPRVVSQNSTLSSHPFKPAYPLFLSPSPHSSARHTLAAYLPPATQPRQTLRLTHTVTQVFVCQT